MIYAALTTIFWSGSAVFARRLIGVLGSTLANFSRGMIAALFLAAWAYLVGQGTNGDGFWWFFASGVVGFGIGDVALYFALARIGSRLSILLTQTLAAPIAALAEWLWLGTTLSPMELVFGAGVLAGVALALVPRDQQHVEPSKLWTGISFGVLAAAGQGLGAVLSRKGNLTSFAQGLQIDGGTAAFQRILGGILFGGLTWFLLRNKPGEKTLGALWPRFREPKFVGLIVATALCGPVIGVGFYQWALATTPSGVVLPIVALTPITIIPLTWWLEGDRPKSRSLLGGALAVASAIALADWRGHSSLLARLFAALSGS